MPIDIFSTAKTIVMFVIDRLEKMGISDDTMKRIIENLKWIEQTIKKIDPYIKSDSDTKVIKEFESNLQNINELCNQISEKDVIEKVCLAESILDQLKHLEAQVKLAYSQLQLFLETNNFIKLNKAAEKEISKKSFILQENFETGLTIVKNKSVKRPPPPPGFTAQESKNKVILSWKPFKGSVERYEVCYDEGEDHIIKVEKEVTSIEIGSPRVSPRKRMYTMKVRAINEGGTGEWSQPAVVQFTKPLPQNPDITKVSLQSTMGFVTVNIPRAVYSTESPVTCIEISSVIVPEGIKWRNCEFKIEPAAQVDNNTTHTFTIAELHPESEYKFRVRSRNAEGWSKHSHEQQHSTLPLPLLPGRPNPPIIKVSGKNMVNIGIKMPENMCSINSPIIAWNIKGYATGLYNTDLIEINEHYESDSNQRDFRIISMEIPDPRKMYTLNLLAKNESGWSEPSKEFIIDITKPLIPKNFRTSSKQSLAQIEILWNAPDCEYITHYEIKRRVKNDMHGKELVKIPSNKFRAIFKNLRQNTSYYFKIRTCYEPRISEWSNEIEASTCSEKYKGVKAVLSAPVAKVMGIAKSPINEKRKKSANAIASGAVGGKAEVSSTSTGSSVDESNDQSDGDNDTFIIQCPKGDNA